VAGAGGKEVGRVSIRVVPDLDRFREDLKKKLEQVERELRGRVAVDVDARLKDSGKKLTDDIEKSTKNLKAEVEAKATGTEKLAKDIQGAAKGSKAKVKVSADTKQAQKQLDRFQRRYLGKIETLLSNIDIASKLTPSGEFNRQAFDDLAKSFRRKVNSLDLSDDLADIADLRFEIDELYREIELKAKKTDLIPKNKLADTKRVIERFASQNQFKVDFIVKQLEFERDIEEALAKSEKRWADLDAKLRIRVEDGEIIKLRTKLSERVVVPVGIQAKFDKGGFTRSAAIAIAGAKELTAAVASPFRLLTAFPGIAAKAFVRLGPEIVAITALIAALLPPVLALGAGLITLAPAALAGLVPIGAIALGLDGIKKAAETAKPAFEELKKSVSSVFENGLPGQNGMVAGFEAIGERLIPNITQSLQGVAQSISNSFNAVVGVLASPKGLSNLNNIFNNVAAGIENAKGGLKGFTEGILQLVSAISNKFPGLGQWFTDLGTKFAGWVEKFTTLKDENGLTGLERTIQNVRIGIEGLTGVFQEFFGQGLKDIQSADFGAGMKSFFESVRSFVANTLPALSEGFKEIANLLKQLSPLFDTFGALTNIAGLFVNPGQTISDAVKRFKETGSLKEAFTGLGTSAEKGGQQAAAGLNKGLETGLEQTKKSIEDSLKPSPGAVSGVFGGGIDKDGIGPAITGKVNTAISAAKSTLTAFQGEFAGMIATALQPLDAIGEKVGQAFSTMGPAINNAFIAAMAGVRNTITGLFAFMVLAIGTQTSKISNSIGEAFRGAPQQVGAALAGVPGAVAGALAPAIAAAANAAVGMLQAMNAGLAALPAVVQAWFGAVPATVQGAMSPAIGTVASVCQQIVSTMLSFAGAAEQAGTAIGASFAKGIASATNLVISSASALMNAARAFFPASPAEKGPFSGSGWVDNSGKAVGEGFAAGMQSSVGGVVDIARVMMQQVKDVFGNAEGLVINFNFNEVAQPISQFSNSIAGIGTSMAGALPAAQEFQQTLGQTGQSLAMLDSSQSKGRIEELKKSLLELEIQRKQLEAARDMPGADQAAIKAQIEQIRNQKNLLGLERDKLTYAQKYGGQMSSTAQSYKEQMNSLQQIPFDFATATSNQFMSDLGWSGQGAIPSLMQQGMDFGTNFIFNVANMDDALSGQRVLQNRTAQATLGR
jgi:phage-related protein/23S rRNA pseudoU1915 N3-methylase RlmH